MILPSPYAPEGSVKSLPSYSKEDFSSSSVILCRNTAPLIKFAFQLIRRNVGCRVLGKEIGLNLITIVKKQNANSVDDLRNRLDLWRNREVERAIRKGEESAAEAIEDKFTCLCIFIENLKEDDRTVNSLCSTISSLFDDTKRGLLTLCTVHKSKGMEWPTVFILDKSKLMPSKWAKTPWAQEQEQNLIYVALTRAQVDLRYIDSDQWRSAATASRNQNSESSPSFSVSTLAQAD